MMKKVHRGCEENTSDDNGEETNDKKHNDQLEMCMDTHDKRTARRKVKELSKEQIV